MSLQPLDPGLDHQLVLIGPEAREVEHQRLVAPGQDVGRVGRHLVGERLAAGRRLGDLEQQAGREDPHPGRGGRGGRARSGSVRRSVACAHDAMRSRALAGVRRASRALPKSVAAAQTREPSSMHPFLRGGSHADERTRSRRESRATLDRRGAPAVASGGTPCRRRAPRQDRRRGRCCRGRGCRRSRGCARPTPPRPRSRRWPWPRRPPRRRRPRRRSSSCRHGPISRMPQTDEAMSEINEVDAQSEYRAATDRAGEALTSRWSGRSLRRAVTLGVYP